MGDIYEIRLKEHLDDCWAKRFDDFTLSHDDDGTTLLVGPVPDQAALYGLLMRVRDLSLTLMAVVRTKAVQDEQP
jgi:cell division septation protein DedD